MSSGPMQRVGSTDATRRIVFYNKPEIIKIQASRIILGDIKLAVNPLSHYHHWYVNFVVSEFSSRARAVQCPRLVRTVVAQDSLEL